MRMEIRISVLFLFFKCCIDNDTAESSTWFIEKKITSFVVMLAQMTYYKMKNMKKLSFDYTIQMNDPSAIN